MIRTAFLAALTALLLTGAALPQEKPGPPVDDFLRLEKVWNEAHTQGDVKALEGLWVGEVSIVVPKMPAFHRAEILEMWRKLPRHFSRYESSNVAARTYGTAAVVTGRILRVKDFGGRTSEDPWQFTKVYVQLGKEWKVVAFQASEAPE